MSRDRFPSCRGPAGGKSKVQLCRAKTYCWPVLAFGAPWPGAMLLFKNERTVPPEFAIPVVLLLMVTLEISTFADAPVALTPVPLCDITVRSQVIDALP